LLRTIGSPQARTALLEHVPFASPHATATALQALAAIEGDDGVFLRPYLDAPEPQVRMAALAGLLQLGDASVRQRAASLLDDPDIQVCAEALIVVLAEPGSPDYARAQQRWEAMFDTPAAATQIAALSVMAKVPDTPLQGCVYRALDHADVEVRHTALRVLQKLATAGRIPNLDSALLRALEADDVESRDLALQVLTAVGTDEALEHMLVLLDDEQPRVRETLIHAVKRYGKRAAEPLFSRLHTPQTSLIAKETALLALARLDSVRAEQFLAFWEGELRDVYRYKLMLASLDASPPLNTDTFLRVALDNAHRQILSLLVQLLAVWASPEVARLVESGLHDTDRRIRANALEALESLSERRFTRLFLPILEAGDSQQEDWREVARRQWSLTTTDIPTLLATCLQDTNTWVVIGAVLSGQARASTLGDVWTEQLEQLAEAATDAAVLNAVGRVLGRATFEAHQALSLTDIMLFLKRIPLYSSMSLDQLRTIAAHMTEREVLLGEIIFREGDLNQELYLIVSGKVDIVKHFGATPHILATLEASEFFGDMAIFEDRPRSADAVGAEEGILLVLSPEHFRQIILQDPAISFAIFRELSARIRRFDEEAMEGTGEA